MYCKHVKTTACLGKGLMVFDGSEVGQSRSEYEYRSSDLYKPRLTDQPTDAYRDAKQVHKQMHTKRNPHTPK